MKTLTRDEIHAWFQRGKDEKFGIPAFNYSDEWDMRAIVETAEELCSPVILMCDPETYEAVGGKLCAAMANVVIEDAKVPVIHHLDHCETPETCFEAIDMGFNSVMIDASGRPLDENIEYVRKVADYAHARNVFVEAEIGHILGESYETNSHYTGDDYLFAIEDAIALVEKGQCDSLAIGLGNAHGFYKAEPKINYDKLKEAHDNISIPLVLHGGTGIPRDTVRACIEGGIGKVNVGTGIYSAYMNGIQEYLKDKGPNQYTYDVMPAGMASVKKEVAYWIETDNAIGKAK